MPIAVRIESFGGPEVLELMEIDEPTAPPDGVVIQVRAAGVNPIDWKIRKGLTGHGELTEPMGLGSDASGVVTSVGVEAGSFQVGDEVFARGLTGAYATAVTAHATQLVRKPKSVAWEQAAAFGMPVGTAYQALKALGVAAGQTLLVHAGAGAVGQAAVQLARNWGLTVIATASRPHHARLAELGAVPVTYGNGLLDRLRAVAPSGIDVVLDAAGTDEALDVSVKLVSDRSRIATLVAFRQGTELGIRVFSEHFGGGLDPQNKALRAEALPFVADLASRGKFAIDIAGRFPLQEVAAAHRQSEAGHVSGKIVLVPDPVG